MKLTIRNIRFQPLTFALADGGSIHLKSREARPISERDVSLEIRRAEEKGFVELIPQKPSSVPAAKDIRKPRREE